MTADTRKPVVALTETRARVVLDFLKDGADNPTVAARMGLCASTVRNYLHECLALTGYPTRAALGIGYARGEFGVAVAQGRVPSKTRLSVTHLGPRPHDQLMATRCCHQLLDDLPTTDRVTNLPARADCDGTR